MKDTIEKIKNSKIIPYVIIIIVAIIVTFPLFKMTLSDYNEFRIHINRVSAIKQVIGEGLFPPTINSKYMNGFGYALNIFYGPITTYIPIIISLFTNSSILSIKIFTVLTVILSGITMYILIKRITNRKLPALIGSLIYMVAPYKLTNIYSRNAVGEYTAFIFIPLVFMGINELLDKNYKKHYLIIIGGACLILSHTITTIYTAIFAIIYMLMNFKKIKNITLWKYLFMDILIILAITCFYWIPLVEHQIYGNYTIYDGDRMHISGAYAWEETNTPLDWLKWELSNDELLFSFGIGILILGIATIFCFKKVDKKYKSSYSTFLSLAFISLFMCTKLFPWFLMPKFLGVIQFAWRLNGFFIFFIALVCGINAMIIFDKSYLIKDELTISAVLIITLMAGAKAFRYQDNYSYKTENKYETDLITATTIDPYMVNREYLPVQAIQNMEYLRTRENRTYIISGKAEIKNENKNKLYDEFELSNVEESTLELPYIYYHGYTVRINGKEIKNFESENGFVCIKTNEEGNVQVQYTGTVIEKIGYVISAVCIIDLIGYFIFKKHCNFK